jgi:hypothetical protein
MVSRTLLLVFACCMTQEAHLDIGHDRTPQRQPVIGGHFEAILTSLISIKLYAIWRVSHLFLQRCIEFAVPIEVSGHVGQRLSSSAGQKLSWQLGHARIHTRLPNLNTPLSQRWVPLILYYSPNLT